LITDAFSEAEQRKNPWAVVDALQVFDKKLREQVGQKYMGARSVEDLTAEPDVTKQQSRKESAADANGVPVLPPKSKDAEGNKSPTEKPVSSEYIYLALFVTACDGMVLLHVSQPGRLIKCLIV